MTTQPSNAGKWLLRIFLGCFLLAVAAPVAVALAVLTLSSDTKALRNAAIHGDDAKWKKKIELDLGSLPFLAARFAIPFLDIPDEAKLAISSVHGIEVSVHELESSHPDRARALAEADLRMTKRGYDRVVCVLNDGAAVSVYVQAKPTGGDLKISALILNENHMVAVSGRGDLEPIFQLAMQKAGEAGLPARR